MTRPADIQSLHDRIRVAMAKHGITEEQVATHAHNYYVIKGYLDLKRSFAAARAQFNLLVTEMQKVNFRYKMADAGLKLNDRK